MNANNKNSVAQFKYRTNDVPPLAKRLPQPPLLLNTGDRYTSYVETPIQIEVVKLSVFKAWLKKLGK